MTRQHMVAEAAGRGAVYERARESLRPNRDEDWFPKSDEAEGGCGVTGFACTIPVGGKHIYEPSIQMRNRGNGKGGGIAACGLVPEDLGVSREVLEADYILQVALLDASARAEVEKEFIQPFLNVDQGGVVSTVEDYRDVPLLEAKPPDVARYFVRVKPETLERFAEERGLATLTDREVEDEFIYQNSVKLNQRFYSSIGEKQAFVLSHSRNLLLLKIVGYAEATVQYYKMPDVRAHVWIAHQRYPTKGRVWHPGGAHPFVGLNEALVHNGDFANYHSVTEYLAQRNVFPMFLTDTEVAVLLFDLMNRVYRYPMEYIIEALAPTTELDFDRLSEKRQEIYRQIQAVHLHAAPDGPWFFIIARSLAESKEFQLVGITDTAMLRPQVFALQEGEVSIGLVCSEKQAIDATLHSLSSEDKRFTPIADKYWNARGGSYDDGGAFLMTVSPEEDSGGYVLRTNDKFGNQVRTAEGQTHCDLSVDVKSHSRIEDVYVIDRALGAGGEGGDGDWYTALSVHAADPALLVDPIYSSDATYAADAAYAAGAGEAGGAEFLSSYIRSSVSTMPYERFRAFVNEIAERTAETSPRLGIEALTDCIDRRYPTGHKKRSSVICILRDGLEQIFACQPLCNGASGGEFVRITNDTREMLRPPTNGEKTLLIDATGFDAQGPHCDAALGVRAYEMGWKHLIHYNSRGTRFHAAGFGPNTHDLRVDCYDNPGDYLASGMDGLETYVHGNAQDQVCQIAKSGKLVVYGDVGQTFLYGSKGGEIYVLGNVAGRPMINSVGSPRVVINGTALDFLAESFMAGDPLKGGGLAIVNGLGFNDQGQVVPLDMPYPGGNLLSLASGGALYVRDPHKTLLDEQLNKGAFFPLTDDDWKLLLPYLDENERLFGVRVKEDLLTADGKVRAPEEVYTKVAPARDEVVDAELEVLGD